jgi:hypothetical protein
VATTIKKGIAKRTGAYTVWEDKLPYDSWRTNLQSRAKMRGMLEDGRRVLYESRKFKPYNFGSDRRAASLFKRAGHFV